MGDLRDQLLKAGLTSKKAVKKAETEQRREHKQKNKNKKKSAADPAILAAGEQAIAEKAEADRARAAADQAARAEKEQRAQVRDILEHSALKNLGTGVEYKFNHGTAIKKLELSKETQVQLGMGKLAIAWWEQKYFVIPDTAAEKVEARMEDIIVYWRAPEQRPGEDDPYGDYQVPDDLMW